jgi:hypothetical protein
VGSKDARRRETKKPKKKPAPKLPPRRDIPAQTVNRPTEPS